VPKTGEGGPSAAWRSLVVPTAGANEPPLRTDRDVGFDLFPKAIWFLLGEKLSPQDADVVMPQVVRFFAEAFEKRASVPVVGEFLWLPTTLTISLKFSAAIRQSIFGSPLRLRRQLLCPPGYPQRQAKNLLHYVVTAL